MATLTYQYNHTIKYYKERTSFAQERKSKISIECMKQPAIDESRRAFLETLEPRTIEILDAVASNAGEQVSEAEFEAAVKSARKEAREARKSRSSRG